MNWISYVQSSVCREKFSFQRCTGALLAEEVKPTSRKIFMTLLGYDYEQ